MTLDMEGDPMQGIDVMDDNAFRETLLGKLWDACKRASAARLEVAAAKEKAWLLEQEIAILNVRIEHEAITAESHSAIEQANKLRG